MTKIKVDIESDEDIIAAKILLKHSNGQMVVKDVQPETMLDKLHKSIGKASAVRESGIDEAFKETY